MQELEEEFKNALAAFRAQQDERNRIIMKDRCIIGMTTTAAATYQKVLDVVAPKIVVVEEAAEILEAHVVTSISKHCEQLIMIGDHKQLRPKPNVYKLERSPHNLGVSLFEKLLKKGITVDQLTVQHRMRPEIRELLVPDIYADLKDHVSVTSMENIKGMKHNLFFIDHDKLEDKQENSSSHSNEYEAKYLLHLADYLLKQGYSKQQITILTPYRGQTRTIRNLIGEYDPETNIKITAIDNYQGEENDIILLSLVRSNEAKRIGFMREATRICVSLSRARKGLYIIGNSKLFASQSDIWKNIFVKLKKKEQMGRSLWLQCDNHEKPVHTEIQNAEAFEAVVNGGCSLKCGVRLECGHACPENCHPRDPDHKFITCDKPCTKSCPNGHKCRNRCYERCRCKEVIEKTMPKCGHKLKVECETSPMDHVCNERCKTKLPCGHMCKNYCGLPCSKQCHNLVEVTLRCGHNRQIECYKSALTEALVCRLPCTATLKCEHPCTGTCEECFHGRLHVPCKQRCGRDLICGHQCNAKCINCPPCEKMCQRKCKHSECKRRCWEECIPCKSPVIGNASIIPVKTIAVTCVTGQDVMNRAKRN